MSKNELSSLITLVGTLKLSGNRRSRNLRRRKKNPYAKDYTLIANLKSGAEDKKYSDVEFGYVKFVYRAEATNPHTNYDYISKAKLLKSMKSVKLKD